MGGGEHHKDKGLVSNIAEHVVGHNHHGHGHGHGHGGAYPPQQGYVPPQGYNPADYPAHPPPQTSGGHGVGAMLAGGAAAAAAAAAAYGSHHGHGGHHVSHGTHNLIPGMGHYSGGKHAGRHGGGKLFKGGKHGKFKAGKFGKHKGKGKMLAFKKWK